ncbi:MAG: Nicotinate-nucleotide pyrophosphorylase [carboxylating] [Phycisphaerae bacterium]|nr:Nicotinate-nucleotide pyrophosphorylase [carboxylating] [Phycisphaerae bacterium]
MSISLAELQIDADRFHRLLAQAREEDLGLQGDITSQVLFGAARASEQVTARLLIKAEGVIAGLALVPHILAAFDPGLHFEALLTDGTPVQKGQSAGEITGPVTALLAAERTLLNFLQRLSGVATLTHHYVQAVAGTGAGIYDTRKTTPGWRDLEKYAVRCGGGRNHRRGLHDAILVKDNHLAGIASERLAYRAFEILNNIAELKPAPKFVEFEVDNLQQFEALLKVVGIDIILLDNFAIEDMRTAVCRRDAAGLRGKVQLEASGGVNLTTVRAIAETGVERISVGALTHSAVALDISLERS